VSPKRGSLLAPGAGASPDVVTVSHTLGRVFDIAAGGVKNAVTDQRARDLRTTLDRYAFFCPMWRSGRQFDAATLYTELAEEFCAVRSAALKLGGKDIRDRSLHLEQRPDRVLLAVRPAAESGGPHGGRVPGAQGCRPGPARRGHERDPVGNVASSGSSG
jgi:hypothetical protein